MNCIRSLIATIVLSSFFIFPSDISLSISHKNHAEQWTQALVQNLSPQEIQLAANVIYLLHANAIIDAKIRQFIIPITRLNQTIRANIINYQHTANELTTLKMLLERLSHVVGARTIYNQTLQTCLNYYNKNNAGFLTESLITLQDYGQKALNEYVENNSGETLQSLHAASKNLEHNLHNLSIIVNFQQELANGKFDEYFATNETTKNVPALAMLDELIKHNHIATQNAEAVLNTLDLSTEHISNLILSANEIYKEHYSALYRHISSEEFDKKYAVTLFGMHDILPTEYQSLLPDPDHIFEHVLQSIKLYTHIEITQ